MAVPGNTRLTFGGVQIREDLSNIIYNISPMDTPFMNGCGKARLLILYLSGRKTNLLRQRRTANLKATTQHR